EAQELHRLSPSPGQPGVQPAQEQPEDESARHQPMPGMEKAQNEAGGKGRDQEKGAGPAQTLVGPEGKAGRPAPIPGEQEGPEMTPVLEIARGDAPLATEFFADVGGDGFVADGLEVDDGLRPLDKA